VGGDHRSPGDDVGMDVWKICGEIHD
jgi:hypothetical protein